MMQILTQIAISKAAYKSETACPCLDFEHNTKRMPHFIAKGRVVVLSNGSSSGILRNGSVGSRRWLLHFAPPAVAPTKRPPKRQNPTRLTALILFFGFMLKMFVFVVRRFLSQICVFICILFPNQILESFWGMPGCGRKAGKRMERRKEGRKDGKKELHLVQHEVVDSCSEPRTNPSTYPLTNFHVGPTLLGSLCGDQMELKIARGVGRTTTFARN